jgi:glycosyltransferase involved in cell wall biosynthesis
MATRHDVWIMTTCESRQQIEEELAARPRPSLRIIFVDWPGWLGRLTLTQVGYYLWQIFAYFVARRWHRTIKFDLVHHVTVGRYWMPSFLAMLPVPFVWGPVGGGESVPRPFWRSLGWKGATMELVRESARWLGERDPFVGLTARRSVLALATTEESRQRIARLGARSLRVISQVGLSAPDLDLLATCPSPEGPVRFVSIGRLHSWKGFHLGLKAFARLESGDAEYWIIGNGPAQKTLTSLARDLGVAERVRFCGAMTRDDTLASLSQAHVLVHPSLHDSGSMVCVEAMAAGKPVICLDLGGPVLLVTSETGFKVPALAPDATVTALAEAMTRLVSSKPLRERMGAAGRLRAREFDWRARGDYLSQSYMSVHG